MHYHLLFGRPGGPVLFQQPYELYEDSLKDFVEFSAKIFSHVNEETRQSLSLQEAAEATEYGMGTGAVVGTDAYSIYWIPCREECHAPQLN